MEVLKAAALATGCVGALIAGVAFMVAGVYEISAGRRPPGFLGSGFLPGSGVVEAKWSENKWRQNGLTVVAVAVGFLMISLWALLALLGLTG